MRLNDDVLKKGETKMKRLRETQTGCSCAIIITNHHMETGDG